MLDILDMGASGLQAQRVRMDTIAQNILNVKTTRNAAGQKIPYQRRIAVFSPGQAGDPARPGVHAKVLLDNSPPVLEYKPTHPDADARGYVKYPNVDLAIEYVNALEASRAYEATVTMMDVTKSMMNSTLRLIA